jgi:hypothetical protein
LGFQGFPNETYELPKSFQKWLGVPFLDLAVHRDAYEHNNKRMNASTKLVGAQDCINIVFPCENSRPSLRCFREWQSRKYFAVHKIGRMTFFDPDDVRRALDRRFKIEASAL